MMKSLELNSSQSIEQRLQELESENIRLRHELDFLKLHPTISQGLRGETLIAQLSGCNVTSYSETYDVLTPTGLRIEVKFSKLNHPMKIAPTRRWNWSKPLGWLDKGKDYDYLLLIGEKDPRYLSQYPDDTPYVYFFVPKHNVPEIMNKGRAIGGVVQITTNLEKLKSKARRPKLLDFHLSFDALAHLIESKQLQPVKK